MPVLCKFSRLRSNCFCPPLKTSLKPFPKQLPPSAKFLPSGSRKIKLAESNGEKSSFASCVLIKGGNIPNLEGGKTPPKNVQKAVSCSEQLNIEDKMVVFSLKKSIFRWRKNGVFQKLCKISLTPNFHGSSVMHLVCIMLLIHLYHLWLRNFYTAASPHRVRLSTTPLKGVVSRERSVETFLG